MDLFGDEIIRTLGLFQPYASAIWLDGKIETRWVRNGFKPPFPLGKYMIYSTKRVYRPEEVEIISGPYFPVEKFVNDLRYHIVGQPLVMATLSIVAEFTPAMMQKAMVLYDETETHMMYALQFTDVKRIKSFPFKGKQGVGILTPEQKSQIEFI